MIKHSLVTKAVIAAFDGVPFDEEHGEWDAIAAVLRTAVTHLAYKDAEGREFIYVPELINIAMELEGVND
jgi:hypothetical protein